MPEDAAATPVSSQIPRHTATVLAWLIALLLTAIFGLVLFYYPPLTDASTPIETPTWVKFFGRFHVIALHLPVGVLVLAALMELFVLVRHRTSHFLAPATTF